MRRSEITLLPGGRLAFPGRSVLLLIALAAVACTDLEHSSGALFHPDPSALASTHFSQILRKDSESPEDLESLRPLFTPSDSEMIGALDGSPDLVFGSLASALIIPSPDDTGRLALLDLVSAEILLFSLDGKPLARSGGFGDGPGEFVAPVSLGPGGHPGEVVVADHSGKLHSFRLDGDSLEFLGRINVRMPIEGGCTAGTQPIVMVAGTALDASESASPTLLALDSAGNVLQAFGNPYLSKDPMARYWYSMGFLACGSEVFAAYMRLGEVHAFSNEGKRLWICQLPDFALVRSFAQPGGFGFDQGYRGVLDMIQGLTAVGTRLLAVRVLSMDYSARPAVSSETTYLLRQEDGEILGQLPSGLRVLGGDDHRVVLYREAPYPQFALRPLPAHF
jgi:hypothetical protein